jgi:tripartite-type tricarboxylate transporter receptor subunit TctC
MLPASTRGRTVTCYVGYGVGGAYDLYAREISKFLPRHIPGEPKVAVENMPGASSMVLANYLARRAPRDGTVLGAVNSALIFDPLFSGPKSKAQFEGPALRHVFTAVMQDPDFQAETARAQLEMSPMSGAEMERNVRAAYALPEALIAKVRRTLAD